MRFDFLITTICVLVMKNNMRQAARLINVNMLPTIKKDHWYKLNYQDYNLCKVFYTNFNVSLELFKIFHVCDFRYMITCSIF